MDEFGIKIFQSQDYKTEIQVIVQSDSVWLSQKQMSGLFKKDSDTIGLHLRNIYKSGELAEKAANILYLVTKNHSFVDRNKRIAAFLIYIS